MSAALVFALLFTVVLLAVSAYFLMGSLPLLVLRHDTPLDSRFVHKFFGVYYAIAIVTAGAAALCYAAAGRWLFAGGAALLALLAAALRRLVMPRMDALRDRLQSSDVAAIAGFQRIHVTAILVNLGQLALTVWSLVTISIQMK